MEKRAEQRGLETGSCPIGYTGKRKDGDRMAEIQIRLAAARVNAGMTQGDVAKRLGISKQTIVNWEKGRNAPGIPEIEMLARIYKIPQDNIFLPCYSTKSRKQDV